MTDALTVLSPLVLLALVGAVAALAVRRGRGPADTVLVTVGGVLVTLVLTGMVLDLTGLGLSRTSWTAALAVLAAAGLGLESVRTLRAGSPTRLRPGTGRAALRTAPWLAACAVVLAVATTTSVRSLSAADVPPLQMSFGTIHGTEVDVVVTSGTAVGPLEVRTSSDGTDVSYPLISVAADGTRTVTLSLPRHGRFTVTLNNPDQTEPLRTLILDR